VAGGRVTAGEAAGPDALADRLAEVYLVVGPLYRRVLREVEADGPGAGVPAGVRAVLDLLHRNGPTTVPQMGRAQSLSRQFVQRTVNEARTAGLVERVDNPAHRRSGLVRLTPEGRGVIEAIRDREHARLRALAGRLTSDDVEATLRVLRALLGELDEIE
jgi:DNA-binding MarR family transcriptional regulator